MLLMCAYAQAASLSVNGFKYSDPAFETGIEVDLADVPGVTGVDAVSAGGANLSLSPYTTDQYAATFGPYADFASFLGATAGDWNLAIHFGASGSAVYDFPVSGFGSPAADPFPPVPTMISPTDGATGVSQTPSFNWDNGGTHTGPMESLFVNVYSLVNPAIGQFAGSSGSIDLNDETWTPSVVLPAGEASFLVQYETNQDEDARVGVPVFNDPSSTVSNPNIAWDIHSGDLFSRDVITFTVIPEPATLSLVALGGLAVIRRRRK
jgi:hypothetical protein